MDYLREFDFKNCFTPYFFNADFWKKYNQKHQLDQLSVLCLETLAHQLRLFCEN